MNESEWLTCTDQITMLKFLLDNASDRKLRLFAVACCRRIWSLLTDERSRKVVEVAEQYADGVVSEQELDVTAEAAAAAAEAASNDWRADQDNGSALVVAVGCFAALEAAYNYGRRYLFGSYREFCIKGGAYAAARRAAGRSVHAVYAARTDRKSAETAESAECAAQCRLLRDIFGSLPFGLLPSLNPAVLAWNGGTVKRLAETVYEERAFDRLPILADALEDAGCTDAAILDHCRSGGPHVRGCWVVDLLLGKE